MTTNTWADVPLFPGYEPTDPEPADTNLSAGRRRTLRQAETIAAGRHPQGTKILHADADRTRTRTSGSSRKTPLTCGSCLFRATADGSWYPKCVHPVWGNTSHSEASDNRAWWPACTAYRPRDEA